MRVLKQYYPNYRNLAVHESSPGGRGVSIKLGQECTAYSYSHFFEDVTTGEQHPVRTERCENLEALTFDDETFDLFITQDVMEHIFYPAAAFKEIARVLKPGGAHVFTAPLVNKSNPSERCAELTPDGKITHLKPPNYHGNPVDPDGSLVTMNWGFDIATFIARHAATPTIIIQIDDIAAGIRAEYIDVMVSFKT